MPKKILLVSCIGCLLVVSAMIGWKALRPQIISIIPGLLRKAPAVCAAAPAPGGSLQAHLLAALKDLEADTSLVKCSSAKERIEIRAAVPRGRPLEWIVHRLSQAAQGTSYHIDDCVADEKSQTLRISFVSPDRARPPVVAVISLASAFAAHTAAMAIVIENFGFEANRTSVDFLSFPEPLTVALIPSAKRSAWTAQIANEYKKEIVVSLPMEPLLRIPPQYAASTIMVHYPEETIRKMVDEAMKIMPNFSGFTNLMGSRALQDTRVMSIILGELVKHHGYFVENGEGPRSVADTVAQSMHLGFVKLDGTIDGRSAAEMSAQLRRFAALAQANGHLVVGAPSSAPVIAALKSQSSFLRQNGVRLVYVSDIIKMGRAER